MFGSNMAPRMKYELLQSKYRSAKGQVRLDFSAFYLIARMWFGEGCKGDRLYAYAEGQEQNMSIKD
jgi:hypothetical protein